MLLCEFQARITIFGQLDEKLLFFDIACLEVIVSCLLRPYEKQNFILYAIDIVILIKSDYWRVRGRLSY